MAIATEVCPSCGDYAELVAFTGWCSTCSSESGERRCDRCEDKMPEYDQHFSCRKCRHSSYLEKHGDKLDLCIANGMTFLQAMKSIRQEKYKAISCYCCGGTMKPASNGESYFCKKQSCRVANNRMRRLIYVKKYPRDKALQEVLRSLNATDSSAT